MSKVRGMKVTLAAVINSEAIDSMFSDYITPKKATILAFNGGTLVEAQEGGLFLIPMGDWFRSDFNGKTLPQVDDFNQLQDLGFTAIKDKIVRREEKFGQEISSQDNVSVEEIDEAVAADSSEQEES